MTAIAVVTPAHGRPALLAETLASVAAQTRPPAEHVVVENGPAVLLSDVVARAPHARYHWLPQPGVQAARNRGVALTAAPWIALLDDDDLWAPGWLAAAAALIAARPELGIVFGDFRLTDGVRDGARTKRAAAPPGWWEAAAPPADRRPEGWLMAPDLARLTLAFQPIFPSASLVRRDVWERIGGFDERLRGVKAEDWEFTLRAVRAAPVGYVPEAHVRIRKHGGNDSHDSARMALGEIQVLEHVLAHQGDLPPAWREEVAIAIGRRALALVDGAFAAGDGALLAEALRRLPRRTLTLKLRAKLAIASLPGPLARGLNRLAQGVTRRLKGPAPPPRHTTLDV